MMMPKTPLWVRALLVVLALLLVLYGLSRMLSALTPFLAAFAIAYILNPSLNEFETRIARPLSRLPLVGPRVDPRGVAVLATLGSATAILVVILLFAIPALASQANDAVQSLPRMIQNVKSRAEPLLETVNLRYPDESGQVRALIEEKVKEKLPDLLAPVTHFLRFALSSTFSFVSLFIHLFVVPVFAGYLLYDMNRIRVGVVGFIPLGIRPWLLDRLRRVDVLLAAFVRGQITVCFILALFYGVALSALGVPLGLLVGFTIGFFNLAPFMAFVAGLPLALIIAWAGDADSSTLLWIVVVFLVGKFADIYVLSPKIVGESIGLHSGVVILVLLLGGEYFGFAGLLLAVPLTAVAAVFWKDLTAAYKRSEIYGGVEPEGGDGPLEPGPTSPDPPPAGGA